jgi:hypothetical protein
MSSKITIDADFFEQLLNCMCNQKYLPMAGPSCLSSEDEKANQKVIDDVYHKARAIWIASAKEEGKIKA